MGRFTTSQGRQVLHCHLGQGWGCVDVDLTPAEIKALRNNVKKFHPDAVEINPPTHRYNCVAHALARSHGWFNYPERLLNDDYDEVSFDSPARGDVVRYFRRGAFMHVAVVTRVSGGEIVRVQSKWAYSSELSHALNDVGPDYGSPTDLFRPRPGVLPFAALPDDKAMPEIISVAPPVVFRGGEEMPEYNSTEEAIQGALARISDPDVYLRVALASTPEAARIIIEELPGVQELISFGPEAKQAALDLLDREPGVGSRELASIALYILQRVPSEEAVRPLARGLREGKFTGINMHLAADALLTSTGIEIVSEDPITVAFRTAEELK